jgi:two-component system response regulator YesN
MKILLVDDEIMAMNYFESLIDWKKLGHEIVKKITNPNKGLEYLINHNVDIVFIDIRMPVMDGITFCKKVLNLNVNTKCVLLTSYCDFEYARSAIKIGVSDYLLKQDIDEKSLNEILIKVEKELQSNKLSSKIHVTNIIRNKLGHNLNFSPTDLEFIRKYYKLDDKMIKIFLWLPYTQYFKTTQNRLDKEEKILENMLNNISYKEILNIDLLNGSYLSLLSYPKDYSPVEKQEIYSISDNIVNNLKKKTLVGYACIPSISFMNIENIPQVFNKVMARSKYLVFYPRYHVILPKDVIKKSIEFSVDDLNNNIEDLFNSLSTDRDNCKNITSKIFKALLATLDYDTLNLFTRKMRKRTIQYCEEKNYTNALSIIEHNENIYSIHDINKYFDNVIDAIQKEVSELQKMNYSQKVNIAIRFIRNNYSKDIGLIDIANEVGVSRERIRHLVKKETGKTISDILLTIRMDKAKELIVDPKLKIFEIAEKVGYNSSSYFCSVFKKYYGLGPFEYRENNDE